MKARSKTSRRRTGSPAARRRTTSKAKRGRRQWSAEVNRKSDALDLKAEIFKSNDPAEIAKSLKRSAEHSKRRKASPFRSAMSMLTFYINRGGKNLPAARKRKLEAAKVELRRAFGRAA